MDLVKTKLQEVWAERDMEYIEDNLPIDYSLDFFAEEIAYRLQEVCEEFAGIDLTRVMFLRKTVKRKQGTIGKKVKRAEAKPIRKPECAFSPYTHIITTWGEYFEELPLDKKQKVIYHEMLHIPEGNILGVVVDHDVEDFAACINTWGGTNWVYSGPSDLLVQMEDEEITEKKDKQVEGLEE